MLKVIWIIPSPVYIIGFPVRYTDDSVSIDGLLLSAKICRTKFSTTLLSVYKRTLHLTRLWGDSKLYIIVRRRRNNTEMVLSSETRIPHIFNIARKLL